MACCYISHGTNYYNVSNSQFQSIPNKFHWIHDLDDVEKKSKTIKLQIYQKLLLNLTDDFMGEPIINELTTKTKATNKTKIVKKVVKKVPVISDKETEELFDLF